MANKASHNNTVMEHTDKTRSHRNTRRQANNEAANNDGNMKEANVSRGSTKVAAIMEDNFQCSQLSWTLAAKLETNAQRLDEAENHISDAEDNIASLQNRMLAMENKLTATLARVDDEELHSHRDNIQIFGVKEGIEGKNSLAFF